MSEQSNVLEKNGKRIPIRPEDHIAVGIDVHTKNTNVVVRKNGQEVAAWASPADPRIVARSLRPCRGARHIVVYEAGPTGYTLYRTLEKEGFCVEVVAPGKTPQKPNKGNKTDHLDARELSQYAAAGLLQPIVVPSPQQERDRQVMRTRDQMLEKRTRAKQQIRSLLRMHGYGKPEWLDRWSQKAIRKLKEMALPSSLRVALDALVATVEMADEQIKALESRLAEIRRERYSGRADICQSHPGVGRLTAMNFLLEIYEPQRFEVARQLSTYLGLVPRIHQSGETAKTGRLRRAGQASLRGMLIQAAWQWVGRDQKGRALYERLVSNTGEPKKAIVGVARKIAVHLWAMVRRGEPYDPER